MPLFKFTTKVTANANGIAINKGMSVEISTLTTSNPLLSNGGQQVQDAFMRIYGIDMKKAGMLSTAYLECKIK